MRLQFPMPLYVNQMVRFLANIFDFCIEVSRQI